MEKVTSFEKLFLVLLSEIYAVENHLTTVIPNLAKRASTKELRDTLQDHLKETKQQIVRLEEIFEKIGDAPIKVEWIPQSFAAYDKIQKFLDDNPTSAVTDAAIIAFAQRIEHYEIATYGTLREFAHALDYNEIKDLFKESLKEEAHADVCLTKLAQGGVFSQGINAKAIAK
jgi:ferritin-like metal-binding protein YciE